MKTTTTPPCRHRLQAGGEDDAPLQSMDESGRGPRTAVAVAVVSPLGVQPSINSAGISSSTGQPLGTIAACKSYALHPVLRPCLAIGRRRCRSPKAGVGELHKAALEAFSSAQVVADVPFTLMAVELQKKPSQEPSVCV
jgi:hypothetical protein